MEYVATFYTHSGAIKYNRYLRSRGINSEVMPVPRKFSSNCGIGVKFATEEPIKTLISEDMEKLFRIEDGKDELIYSG
jgi:hypothetical protein